MRQQDIEHLFRRVGLGASRQDVAEYARLGFLGFPNAAAHLVDYARIPDDVDDYIGTPALAQGTDAVPLTIVVGLVAVKKIGKSE
jgi:hypothetical protein